MLLSLRIENFALVDSLDLEFGNGLNVLTGETGAGKSIILDAIDAALGGKVVGRAIRTGAGRAMIDATFKLTPDLAGWLAAEEIAPIDDLSDERLLVCTREVTASQGGTRSRSRVNGVVVNRQQMEQLRDRIVEITAQGQTVQLGQPNLQREWLDGFGGQPLLAQRQTVATAFSVCQDALQKLEKRRQLEQQRLQQLDLLEYQVRELNNANLNQPDELEHLEQERQRLSHVVELQQQSYQVYQALYENDNDGNACADLLGRAEILLNEMATYDTQLQPIVELVTEALAQVEEAGRQINAYGEALETDPEQLQVVETRILDLKQICRKYGPTLAETIDYHQKIQADLETLTDGDQSLEDLEQNYHDCRKILIETCAQLTTLRQAAAQDLEARLIEELKPLAMDKVRFQVEIVPIEPTATGADRLIFRFSPNPGEPMQPLAETASGGEMSRFLLALKACFSQVDPVETLVFDEIDVGVSGRVAQAIAEKLHQLGQQHQVLCVTHQPIVAAMADTHFRVDKQLIDREEIVDSPARNTRQGKKSTAAASTTSPTKHSSKDKSTATDTEEEVRTVVRVAKLADESQRREELAQLAGGQSAEESIAFAESLLNRAAAVRKTKLPDAAASARSASKSAAKGKTARSRKRGSSRSSSSKQS